MIRIEYKEGNIWCGKEKADSRIKGLVAFLSVQTGKTEKETCDLINQIMQSFGCLIEKINDIAEKIKDIFNMVKSDTCESCESCEVKRTKHGSSCIAKSEVTGKTSIKWNEKYRPP